MFGPFEDQRVQERVGQIFGSASERIRDARSRSLDREATGQRARREDADTEQLILDFETAVLAATDELESAARDRGVEIEIKFYSTNFLPGEENRSGADIGVRLHIEAPGFNVTKAVLFQNKRIYGRGGSLAFNRLRGDGELQARKMLNATPASFFLLFNGMPISTAGQMIKLPESLWPHHVRISPEPEDVPGGAFWELVEADPTHFGNWNTGILVLPASRLFAESRMLENQGRPLPIGARHWIRASIPLGIFMADFFGSCFVGDVRDSIIRMVTPPVLRDLASSGLPDDEPEMLPARRILNISVRPG